MDAFVDVVAASIAGAAGIVAGQPFDTIKVRLQTQPSAGSGASPLYKGPVDCALKILRQEGPRGFFKGMLSPIVANAPINAVLFAVEGLCVKQLRRQGWRSDAVSTHILAGGLSGLSQTMLASPSELVKIRLQCQIDAGEAGAAQGPWEMARSIARSEGALALFRGFSLTCARDVPAFAIYFTSYWYLKQQLADAFPWMRARAIAGHSAAEPLPETSGVRNDVTGTAEAAAGDAAEADPQWPGEAGEQAPMEHPGERGSWQGGYWESDFVSQAARRRRLPAPVRPGSPTTAAVEGVAGSEEADTELPPERFRAGPAAQLLAGGLAGTASWLFLHPVDVLKSVVQRQTALTPASRAGPLRAAAFHLRQDGPGFCLRGIVPTCLRAFPASAVIFLVYETIRPLLRF